MRKEGTYEEHINRVRGRPCALSDAQEERGLSHARRGRDFEYHPGSYASRRFRLCVRCPWDEWRREEEVVDCVRACGPCRCDGLIVCGADCFSTEERGGGLGLRCGEL